MNILARGQCRKLDVRRFVAPPGLQKKLYRTGHLPPGWEKKLQPHPRRQMIVDVAPVFAR